MINMSAIETKNDEILTCFIDNKLMYKNKHTNNNFNKYIFEISITKYYKLFIFLLFIFYI